MHWVTQNYVTFRKKRGSDFGFTPNHDNIHPVGVVNVSVVSISASLLQVSVQSVPSILHGYEQNPYSVIIISSQKKGLQLLT